MQPAALELHLAAAEDVEKQRQSLHQHWQQKLERAGYEAERAARQYGEVEPENRLVARELERRWEEALHEQRRLQQEYDQFCAERPAQLSAAQREQIRQLAQDIPALWSATSTTAADRQQLVRLLIERIVVEIQGQSEQVKLAITWSGGFVSQHAFVRTVRQLRTVGGLPTFMCPHRGTAWRKASRWPKWRPVSTRRAFSRRGACTRFSGGMVAGLLARKYAKAARATPSGYPKLCGRASGYWATWRGTWACRKRRCITGGRRAGCAYGSCPCRAASGQSGRPGKRDDAWPAFGVTCKPSQIRKFPRN